MGKTKPTLTLTHGHNTSVPKTMSFSLILGRDSGTQGMGRLGVDLRLSSRVSEKRVPGVWRVGVSDTGLMDYE